MIVKVVKWFKELFKNYNQIESDNLRPGIINVTTPYVPYVYTHIDRETYEKYINRKNVSKGGVHTKTGRNI